jgi:hypothetical protein
VEEASVNGVSLVLDAAPYINPEVDRTLVPVRFISEALDAGVAWDPEKMQVVINDGEKEIVLTIGSLDVQIDGEIQVIDCAPAIQPPGRTFVPLRFIMEAMEAEVEYDYSTGQVIITR